MTGEILVAGVDRRIGGATISTAAQWEWGDARTDEEWAKAGGRTPLAWTRGMGEAGLICAAGCLT